LDGRVRFEEDAAKEGCHTGKNQAATDKARAKVAMLQFFPVRILDSIGRFFNPAKIAHETV